MKKNIIKLIIALTLIITAIVSYNTDAKAQKCPITFCNHGSAGNCYAKTGGSAGFECGEGPWMDCNGTWTMD